MTNEQFERQIEFILKQQADFWAGVQKLELSIARLEIESERSRADIEALTGKMDTLADLVGHTAQAVTVFVERSDHRQERVEKNLETLGQRIDRLAAALERRFGGDGQ